jgi:hypothetical protein
VYIIRERCIEIKEVEIDQAFRMTRGVATSRMRSR